MDCSMDIIELHDFHDSDHASQSIAGHYGLMDAALARAGWW